MKIIQINTGIIPIPTKGWGAVEKIIWEYKQQLEFLGYDAEILYTDEVNKNPNQIVHVHMANLANILYERGIEYVFSLHDHHTEYFGKDSDCYRENYTAIKNSKLTFVHSPHLIEYFNSLPNIVYLPHGVNLKEYNLKDRSELVRNKVSLVMLANNGIGGNPLLDRKGFLTGIETAKILNLPITIMCPGQNKQFFEHHNPTYDGLTILYDLDHEQVATELSKHTIFLNPSTIEAGHPNLTVVESLATGLPVVGTSYVEIPGLIRCGTNVEDVVSAVKLCLSRYDVLTEQIKENRNSISWEIVVCKMVQHYKRAFQISEKEQLINQYTTTKKRFEPKQDKNGITVSFADGKAFVKTSIFSEGLSVVFRNNRTNSIMYETVIGKTPGQWCYIYAPHDTFIDWDISINYGIITLHREKLSLEGKKVLITGDVDLELLEDFSKATGSFTTIQRDSTIETSLFYTTYNEHQIKDFFNKKARTPDRYLLSLSSKALGDSIGFVPYAQKWAEKMGIWVDVSVPRPEIFNSTEYPNLTFIEQGGDESKYNQIYRFEYQFNKPLMLGYSDQFGLDYEETQPRLRKSGLNKPLKERYAVLGVQTTSQCKYWNYPGGWEELCNLLSSEGITPVSVDRYEVFGIEGNWNSLPDNSIKKVGMDFNEVIRWIEHCDIFIGVSSGLAWLAYGLGKKVVMITGTTEEANEFEINNIVVSNRSGCNGCFNKPELHRFNSGDWLWCPIHKGTDRQFECTKTITPEMVMAVVKENI